MAGLIFSGVQPRWVTPRWDAQRHISHPPSPDDVDAVGALPRRGRRTDRQPEPVRHPRGPRGHRRGPVVRGKPLIVDEAGAHLPFHEKLPIGRWTLRRRLRGHVHGAGFEQGSVFHLQGDLHQDRYRRRRPADDHQSQCQRVRGDRRVGAARWFSMATSCSAPHGISQARCVTISELIPDLQVLDDELIGSKQATIWTAFNC